MYAKKESNLKSEFTNLIRDIGSDVSKLHLFPVVKEEFAQFKGNLNEQFEGIQNKVLEYNTLVNENIISLLDKASNEIGGYEKSLSDLKGLNEEFINKTKSYLENLDLVKQCESIAKQTDRVEDVYNDFSKQYEYFMSNAKDYYNKVNQLLSSLSDRIPAINKDIEKVSKTNEKMILKIDESIEVQKLALREINNIIAKQIETVNKNVYESKNISEAHKKESLNNQEMINTKLINLEKVLIGRIEDITTGILDFQDNQKELKNSLTEKLNSISNDTRTIIDTLQNQISILSQELKVMKGINIAILVTVILILFTKS